MTTKNFGILIHGGAGSNKRATHSKEEADIIKIIEQAAYNGFDFLKSNYNIHTNNSTTAAFCCSSCCRNSCCNYGR